MTSLQDTPKSLGNILGTTIPTPMEKPPAPSMVSTVLQPDRQMVLSPGQGSHGYQAFASPGIGAGKPVKKAAPVAAQKAKNQQSQSDTLNIAELQKIRARNAAKQATGSTILMNERFA